jgi:hypothetical protein
VDSVSLYAWKFDRLPADRNPAFLTCSVAIYQWLPKASGRGLKKVNAARVCGYLQDRQAVYCKAQEICDRLNAAKARADARPRWLQKQYSVPKPAGLIVPKISKDLSGAAVRAIRLDVARQLLSPAGFTKSAAGTYVRQVGDQIHLITFQPARFGHEYTVNFGFHFAFIVPLFAGKPIPVAKYQQLDCGLRARIGDFAKNARDEWFPYGTDAGELRRQFAQNAQDCLRVFEAASRRFASPSRLLTKAGCTLNMRLIRPWQVQDGLFAPYLAIGVGRRNEAIQALEKLVIGEKGSREQARRRILRKLKSS